MDPGQPVSLYRSLVYDTSPGLLRQILTTAHGDLWPGRDGATYLRPLWDAYLTKGRARLRDLGNLAADEPEFAPRWARGDVILGRTLIDIKTGWGVRDRLDYCLNQLLGYLLLNAANRYAIDTIGVYLARHATTVTWPITTLLPELTGQPDPALHQLQQEFMTVCRPSIDQDLSWLQTKQAKDQPRHP